MPIANLENAWVELFQDSDFGGTKLRVEYPTDIADLDVHGFGNQCSSVRWEIPAGWQCVLYDCKKYEERNFSLKGNGHEIECSDLADLNFNDKCSSLRWEEMEQPT